MYIKVFQNFSVIKADRAIECIDILVNDMYLVSMRKSVYEDVSKGNLMLRIKNGLLEVVDRVNLKPIERFQRNIF